MSDTLSRAQARTLTGVRGLLEALGALIDEMLLADTEGKELDADGNRLPAT
jgi:hypothetical protein